MRKINIADIRVNGGTQSRAEINKETVAEYAEAIEAGAQFPAIVVFYDGSTYWLADGFHRYEAHSRARAYDVMADVRQGTQRDAILHSVGANAAHGLRRTNDDKRRAVMVLLNDPEWSAWSANQIAKQCGVSHTFVNGLKSSLETNSSEARTYTTKHGTTATMNTANIGAGSNPVQDVTTPEPQENKGETAESADEVTTPSNPAQDQSAPDPHRKGISTLTREGLEDEVAGLRAALADEAAARKKSADEVVELKERVKELSSDNQGATISRLQNQIASLKMARDDALERAAKETRRANFMEKERNAARKSLGMQEVEI